MLSKIIQNSIYSDHIQAVSEKEGFIMKISIIIPVYNSGITIKRTIDSLLNQTNQDFEVIIVNDGSTDDTKNHILNKIKNISNFYLIDQVNGGASSARNTGIKKANGDYLSFIDADDVVSEYYVQEILSHLSSVENTCDLVVFGYNNCIITNGKMDIRNEVVPDINQFTSSKNMHDLVPYLITANLLNPLWNKVYRRNILIEHNINLNESYILGEDLIFNLSFFDYCTSTLIIEKSLYYYVATSGSLTQTDYINKYDILYPVTADFKEYLVRNDLDLLLYYERLFRNFFTSIISSINTSKDFQTPLMYTSNLLKKREIIDMRNKYNPTNNRDKILINFVRSNSSYIILSISYFLSKQIKIKKRFMTK